MKAKKTRRGQGALLVFVFVVALAGLAGGFALGEGGPSGKPDAKDGIVDLDGYSFEKSGTLSLEGEWRFSWGSLRQGSGFDRTIRVPGIWSGQPDGQGGRLPSQGYGTYRLELRHLPTESRMLGIRLPNLSTAYALYVDGALIGSKGVPGESKSSTKPYQMPDIVFFQPSGNSAVLTLELANFHHRTGGIRSALVLGTPEQIKRVAFVHEAREFIVLGCLLMIGIYHIGLYALRRKELDNLLFAMLCICVAGRMSVIGEGLLPRFVPEMTWTAAGRLEYSFFVLSALSGFAYFRRTYSKEITRRWTFVACTAAGALMALTWGLPLLESSSLILYYQAFVVVLSVASLYLLIVALIRGREGAALSLIGVAGLVGTVLSDIFFYNGWWRAPDMVPLGLLFLVVMNSFLISLRFSRTFAKAEKLSAELRRWNGQLEQRIAERTEALHAAEQSRRQLVSNISHDLRTPMTLIQGYLEALRDGVISDPEQREAVIGAMLKKAEGLNELIRDLFDLSMLEARQAQMTYELVPLPAWLERLAENYRMEMITKGIAFDCRAHGPAIETACVKIDEGRMDRVMSNLIYNAIQATPRGGEIRIEARRGEWPFEAEIAVLDNGSGLLPEDLPKLFERFYRNDKARNYSSGGSGLGLAIAREIVETHGGRIEARIRPEGGSAFAITLPIAVRMNGEEEQ
ncbi:His Kinase A (phospho-acceptor) domain-containing protein [Cohnella sp. OV330]|uniref:sensor histidine kinase n=1 Tax=Cohnella sp. OV330 TaxID=1855288 RepID=UPI0008E4405A|nr:sensor histidine kinase [Cohnella sp. OV330]SFB17108.1 His Kinase A (phospho-acceptor) domain-containing protein [Cohnella sp. OV330]